MQLFLFHFYPLLQRYLQPHQQEVTKILTFLAQASHELVPAEVSPLYYTVASVKMVPTIEYWPIRQFCINFLLNFYSMRRK